MIKEQFKDKLIIIMMVLGLINMIAGIVYDADRNYDDPKVNFEWKFLEGLSINIAMFFIIGIASGNEYMKEKQF
jgi:uncharacterized ion transporter superfamily protein YfcC